MKIKQLLTKTLLVAAGLCAGTNAWAYSLPEDYEIKKVFVGTDNGDGTVTPLTFTTNTYDSKIFGSGTCYHATEAEKLKVVDYTYIAPPAIGELAVDGDENEIHPTYVGATGKVLQWHSRSNATQYGTISMDPVSSGKLVFGIDLNFGGYNTNYAPQIIFVDGDGNRVLQLGFNCNSGATEYFQYVIGTDGTATNDGTVGSSKLRGKYTGHSIRDIVIDLETGDVVYTLDCIGTDGKRFSKTSTKGINIGTGKTIAGIRLSRNFAQGSQSDYIWADNIELYSVGPNTKYAYTIKATANDGANELQTLSSGTTSSGKDYSASIPHAINYGGSYYVLDDAENANLDHYLATYTMGTAEEDRTINYTLNSSIVYYSEAESMTCSRSYGTGSGKTYSNNGGQGVFSGASVSSSSAVIANAGVYTVTACGIVRKTNTQNYLIRFSLNGEDWISTGKTISFTNSTTGDVEIQSATEVTLPANSYIRLTESNGNNAQNYLDYVMVTRTGDASAINLDLTSKITNPSFEEYAAYGETSVNHPTGWTIVGENSGAGNDEGKYGNIIASGGYWTGNYAYVTGWAGQNIYQTLTDMPAGIYTLTADANSWGATVALIANGGYSATSTLADGADKATLSYTFVMTSAGDLTIGIINTDGQEASNYLNLENNGSWGYRVDNFKLTFTGNYDVSTSITSAGWATLYTDYALDFSKVEGLEAYTATLSDNTVTLTKVDNIPANTGVVLKGNANTYSIPVIASSEMAHGDMKGSTTEAKAASEQSPIYILKLNANNEAQFMRATSGSLAAGKAYLEINNGQAKALTVVFANDPTGIATVNAAETVQPVKRIVNGQLVIEKNGKRYNAAGAEF
jgi:hypothetical protein